MTKLDMNRLALSIEPPLGRDWKPWPIAKIVFWALFALAALAFAAHADAGEYHHNKHHGAHHAKRF